MSNLRIGFVGTGMMGRTHLKILSGNLSKKLPIEVVGAIASSSKSLHSRSQFGRTFKNLTEMLEAGVNVVFLTNPHFARSSYEKVLLESKTSFFEEKPHSQEPDRLVESQINGFYVQAGFHWRYLAFNRILQERLKGKHIERITAKSENILPFQSWKLDYQKSLGSAYEKAAHVLDYCSYITKKRISNVSYKKKGLKETKAIDPESTLPNYEKLDFLVGEIPASAEFKIGNKEKNIVSFFCEKVEYSIILEEDSTVSLYERDRKGVRKGVRKIADSKPYEAYEAEDEVFLRSVFCKKNLGLVEFSKTQMICDMIAIAQGHRGRTMRRAPNMREAKNNAA